MQMSIEGFGSLVTSAITAESVRAWMNQQNSSILDDVGDVTMEAKEHLQQGVTLDPPGECEEQTSEASFSG